MTALDDVLAARAHLHSSTYWAAAQRQKGSNKLWLTDVDLVQALADLQPTPPPPPPPPPPDSFTKKLMQGGNLDTFLDSLVPGDVAGIEGGRPWPVSSYHRDQTGTAAKPIVVTSLDPAHPAIIGDGKTGRISVFGNAAYWTFRNLGLDGRTPDGSSWTLGGTSVTFDLCDMSNFNTNIGVMGIDGTGVTISRSRIHDCGVPGSNGDHGIYNEGDAMHVVDCLIYRCAARGIQCRGGHNDLYEYVTISECGEGIIFGDDRGAVNSRLTKSILVNNKETSRFLVEEFDPSHNNRANTVDDCYVWNKDGRDGVQPNMREVAATNIHKVDPKLDGNLMAQAAQGYGCRVIPPKILSNA